MRHLTGMRNIQMYEFIDASLAAVLVDVALFIAANPENSWDLKQECQADENDESLFIVYLYATPL